MNPLRFYAIAEIDTRIIYRNKNLHSLISYGRGSRGRKPPKCSQPSIYFICHFHLSQCSGSGNMCVCVCMCCFAHKTLILCCAILFFFFFQLLDFYSHSFSSRFSIFYSIRNGKKEWNCCKSFLQLGEMVPRRSSSRTWSLGAEMCLRIKWQTEITSIIHQSWKPYPLRCKIPSRF